MSEEELAELEQLWEPTSQIGRLIAELRKTQRERDELSERLSRSHDVGLCVQSRDTVARRAEKAERERDEARKTALRDVQTALESQTVSANELPGVMWAVGVVHRLRALAGSKTE